MPINPTIRVIDEQNDLLGWPSEWANVGDGGYLRIGPDSSEEFITIPSTQISDSSRQVFALANRLRSVLSVRMRYTDLTVVETPVIRVFGRAARASTAQEWQSLRNRNGLLAVELPCEASDLSDDGGNRLTTVDLSAHCFDIQGCNQFLVGVQRILQTTGGTLDKAMLEVRFT